LDVKLLIFPLLDVKLLIFPLLDVKLLIFPLLDVKLFIVPLLDIKVEIDPPSDDNVFDVIRSACISLDENVPIVIVSTFIEFAEMLSDSKVDVVMSDDVNFCVFNSMISSKIIVPDPSIWVTIVFMYIIKKTIKINM
jgi:hypothetical protein